MTIRELQKRYESGVNVTHKATKKAIRHEVNRKCKQTGCNYSLSFQPENVLRCPEHQLTKKMSKYSGLSKRELTKRKNEARKKKINIPVLEVS